MMTKEDLKRDLQNMQNTVNALNNALQNLNSRDRNPTPERTYPSYQYPNSSDGGSWFWWVLGGLGLIVLALIGWVMKKKSEERSKSKFF